MAELRQEYHDQLDALRGDVVRLAAMTSETIGKGTAVLLDRDLSGAQHLIDGDDVIDEFSLGLEEQCTMLLGLQAPIAGELRFLLTTMRVISELERSADLMVNVCKASRRVYDLDFGPELRGLLEQMGVEAAFLVRTAIDSYIDADSSLAAALDDIDDRLDNLQVNYVEAIFESHHTENLPLQAAVQLALIGRYYERIGDHAVNIGERVVYMVTGWLPEQSGAARQALRGVQSSDSLTQAELGKGSPDDRTEADLGATDQDGTDQDGTDQDGTDQDETR